MEGNATSRHWIIIGGMVVLGALLASRSSATDWHVLPEGTGDAPTIQAAVDSAAPSDVVILEAGTFTGPGNRNVDFLGKAITVTSANGAEATIIDCQGLGRGFVFQSGEENSSILQQLTVLNGTGQDKGGGYNVGGAIVCLNAASPTIRDCRLIDNVADDWGGAIACDDQSSPWITNNYIAGNHSNLFGGAILCADGSSPLIEYNTIINNSALASGGGIDCGNVSNATIRWNTISYNVSTETAGGINCTSSDLQIIGNTVCHNSADNGEGNTIAENAAPIGGGIACLTGSEPSIENCIIAFSTNGQGIFIDVATPTLTCSNIYGNAGGDHFGGIDGGGNFSSDPQFCGIPGSGTFLLQSDSPCLPVNNSCEEQIGALPMGCGTTPVSETTWGAIKARFRN
jgi:hypothetical protein